MNSQQTTTTIKDWIHAAASDLAAVSIKSARLDAELILAHTIRQPRTYLHAHGDKQLDERRENIANARLELRLERTPIAYIIGHKEFYGRKFKTTPAALIPRIESETMIDLLANVMPSRTSKNHNIITLIDVGTGTGCLGITAKLQWPKLNVILTDISSQALSLAKENAEKLGAKVTFLKINLLRGLSQPIDIILANLPYVDKATDVSPETVKEPQEALYSSENGLAHIYQLIEQASQVMKKGGYLFLESEVQQQEKIISHAKKYGFLLDDTRDYITQFRKD